MASPNLMAMGEAIAALIRNERKETFEFVNEVQVFLINLPENIDGREYLNTAREHLLHKCEQYFSDARRNSYDPAQPSE